MTFKQKFILWNQTAILASFRWLVVVLINFLPRGLPWFDWCALLAKSASQISSQSKGFFLSDHFLLQETSFNPFAKDNEFPFCFGLKKCNLRFLNFVLDQHLLQCWRQTVESKITVFTLNVNWNRFCILICSLSFFT